MINRILISPNSFKECAHAVAIAEVIRDNLSSLEQTELIVKPVTDGGDGFLEVCHYYFESEIRNYTISTTYDESIFECPVLYSKTKKEVYIESAEVLGLKRVPIKFRNPLKLSSKGLGELLKKIEHDNQNKKISVKKVYIGIGGTATMDMGMGMMSQLGLILFDTNVKKLDVLPEYFEKVRSMEFNRLNFSFEMVPIIDVINPLFGDQGGVRTFGKQKGANQWTISTIEKDFNHLLKVIKNSELWISGNNLSGAGGGIPASFQIFYNSKLLRSEEFILNNFDLNKYFETDHVDFLITGEGAYDLQSGFGKGAGILISQFHTKVKYIFLICGKIDKDVKSKLPKNVIPLSISDYFKNEAESIINYKMGIELACQRIMDYLSF